MNIYAREMRRNARTLLIWSLSFLAYNGIIFGIFPSMKGMASSFEQLMGGMKGMLDALNMGNLDFGNILSYYSSYACIYFVLGGAIYAALLGAGIFAKEETDRTSEFLLSKPVSRSSIAAQKLLAAFSLILIFALAFTLEAAIGLFAFGASPFGLREILIIFLGSLLPFAAYAAIGFLVATVARKPKAAASMGMGIVLGGFMLGVVSRLTSGLEWLDWFSPLDWFNSTKALAAGSLDGLRVLVCLGLIAACAAGGILAFNKKDFRA